MGHRFNGFQVEYLHTILTDELEVKNSSDSRRNHWLEFRQGTYCLFGVNWNRYVELIDIKCTQLRRSWIQNWLSLTFNWCSFCCTLFTHRFVAVGRLNEPKWPIYWNACSRTDGYFGISTANARKYSFWMHQWVQWHHVTTEETTAAATRTIDGTVRLANRAPTCHFGPYVLLAFYTWHILSMRYAFLFTVVQHSTKWNAWQLEHMKFHSVQWNAQQTVFFKTNILNEPSVEHRMKHANLWQNIAWLVSNFWIFEFLISNCETVCLYNSCIVHIQPKRGVRRKLLGFSCAFMLTIIRPEMLGYHPMYTSAYTVT